MEGQQTPNSQMIIEKYTELLKMDDKNDKAGRLIMLVSDMRFFVIQIVIVSLQHLNRSQSAIVLIVNLGYLVYFVRMLLKGNKLKTRIFLIKEIAQEVSIMVLISTITLFSFTEDTGFNSSLIYKVMEILAVFSIIGVCGVEFIILVSDIFDKFYQRCSKKPKKNRKEVSAKINVFDLKNEEEKDFAKQDPKKMKETKTKKKELTAFQKEDKEPEEFPWANNPEKLLNSDQNEKDRIEENNPPAKLWDFLNQENNLKNREVKVNSPKNRKIDITTVQKGMKIRTNQSLKIFRRGPLRNGVLDDKKNFGG